jgi:hypothetical protein
MQHREVGHHRQTSHLIQDIRRNKVARDDTKTGVHHGHRTLELRQPHEARPIDAIERCVPNRAVVSGTSRGK